MDEYNVYPRKVRGLGNVMNKISQDEIELFKASIEEITPININNVELGMFKIQLQGVPVVLSVEGDTSITSNTDLPLTFILTTEEGVPVEGVDLFIYENSVLLDSVETNSDGNATYKYNSSVKGSHSLEIVSYNQLEFDGTSKTVEIYVYKESNLRLTVCPPIPLLSAPLSLIATLKDENNVPLVGKTITFYEDGVELGVGVTNDFGQAVFIIENIE